MPHVGGIINPGGFTMDPIGIFEDPGTNPGGTLADPLGVFTSDSIPNSSGNDSSATGLSSQPSASDSEQSSGKSNKFKDWFNTWLDSLWGPTGSKTPIASQAAEELSNLADNSNANNSADTSGTLDSPSDVSIDESSDLTEWLKQFENYVNKQYEFNQASADKAMAFEADQARINREWQEMMSNTSYQRAVADMKKAGINPLLAFSSMSGASTPSGSAASGTSASGSLGNFSSFYSSLMSSFNNNKNLAANFIGSIVKIIGLLMMFA